MKDQSLFFAKNFILQFQLARRAFFSEAGQKQISIFCMNNLKVVSKKRCSLKVYSVLDINPRPYQLHQTNLSMFIFFQRPTDKNWNPGLFLKTKCLTKHASRRLNIALGLLHVWHYLNIWTHACTYSNYCQTHNLASLSNFPSNPGFHLESCTFFFFLSYFLIFHHKAGLILKVLYFFVWSKNSRHSTRIMRGGRGGGD